MLSLLDKTTASSGQLKICTIRNRGVGLGTANSTYTGVPILGDGFGAEATIVVNNDSKVETITVSKGGEGYSYGTVDLVGWWSSHRNNNTCFQCNHSSSWWSRKLTSIVNWVHSMY